VSKILVPAAGLALACTAASAAHAAPSRGSAPLWVVSPAEASCTTQLELVARSGAITPVTLSSDGQVVSLTFAKPDLPERAFLPIRVDRNRYSNLMIRKADGVTAELVLSEETEAAMRKGQTLDVAWLGEEPASTSLAGSEQGLSDLRVCGAQIATQARARAKAETEARLRAEQEAREQAVAQAQLEAARAQTAAADAQRQRLAEEAERQQRLEDQERQRLYAEAQRRRAYEDAERRRVWEEEQASSYFPPQPRYPIYPQPTYPYRRW
jgi:DNA segregation ATPase FtsK/SpoIIIE-like protein